MTKTVLVFSSSLIVVQDTTLKKNIIKLNWRHDLSEMEIEYIVCVWFCILNAKILENYGQNCAQQSRIG